MITPSFALTATERVLPKLALDFTTANLDSRVTFTRTTDATNPATYTNSSGYVTAATNNQPRFDYNPVTLVCKGLLIEESRSNLMKYSDQFNDGVWGKAGVTISQDVIVSPNGTSNGDKFIINNGSSGVYIVQTTPIVSGTSYTFTVYAKAGEATQFILLGQSGGFGSGIVATYDLSAGTVSGYSTATITNVGNSWYRCSITATATTTTTDGFQIRQQNVTGDGFKGFYIWGAQLEAGAFATSYIPTTTTVLTRNADVATMTGTNFSDWWTATTGAVKTAVIPSTISGTRPLIQFDDNTATNQICLRGNSANPELYIKATTDQSQIDAGTIVANTAYKLSGAWNTNNCAAAQNGASPVTDSSATIPTVTQARIGSDGTNYANAWIQKISYWPQRLINAEVQAFSKI